jgi:hypothetical protein
VGDKGEESIKAQNERFSEIYDYVILATPFRSEDIDVIDESNIDNTSAPPPDLHEVPFRTTFASFIEGEMNLSFFHPKNNSKHFGEKDLLVTHGTILTINSKGVDEEEEFVSIGSYHFNKERNTTIYKLFSKKRLTIDFVSRLFSRIRCGDGTILFSSEYGDIDKCIQQFDWLAYPSYSLPAVSFSSFKPFPGFYYVNAFESVVSCIECMCIAANNIAALLVKDILSINVINHAP